MREILRVILHCSATPDYPGESGKFDLFGAADIDVWHRKRGWNGIGYHRVIRRTGAIEQGRPDTVEGAHVAGHNANTLGVCYIGTKMPTNAQVATMLLVASELHLQYGIEADDWVGHYELDAKKTCPGFPMQVFREMLRYYLKG